MIRIGQRVTLTLSFDSLPYDVFVYLQNTSVDMITLLKRKERDK